MEGLICGILRYLDQTSLVDKEFIIWPKRELFSCRINANNPEQERQTHPAGSGRQSEHKIHSQILPYNGHKRSHIYQSATQR